MKELFGGLKDFYGQCTCYFEATLSIFAKAVDTSSRESEGHTIRQANMTDPFSDSVGKPNSLMQCCTMREGGR